ncbi:hypothetical protein GCM10010124_26560 [Pilimelia terevasa]|uniref:Uncharacterized protein n=1 Tax=Pilimelia terevasa TaxID=53372 RepID=A0A8J3FKB2_9ACTN|nr:hypothetical protein [Pilimelia terevasa]GGK32470.1 hypothetical protein GCM10010124_26560 [Pilimelia terevasa]
MLRGKILGYLITAAVLFVVLKNPTGAADNIRNLAEAVGRFLSALIK